MKILNLAPKISHISLFLDSVAFKTSTLGMNFHNFWKITISTDNGLVSSGEVCFLPGFSKDMPIHVLESFNEISQDWEGKKVPTVTDFFTKNLFSTTTIPPSLSFALEAALFVLCIRIHGWIEPHFSPHKIPICGFIPSALLENPKEWQELIKKGFLNFKCKIDNKKNLEKLLSKVSWLQKSYPEKNFLFRLDSNQKFSLESWKKIALLAKKIPIEYWEEPVKLSKENESIYKEFGIKYAIDESFRKEDFKKYANIVDTIVVKPSIWQGFRKCYQDLEDLCLMYPDKKVVLSSSYECSFGILHLCLLHKLLGLQTYCGFDTLKLFSYTQQSDELCRSPLWELQYENHKGFSLRGNSL